MCDTCITETITRWEREEVEETQLGETQAGVGQTKGCVEVQCPPFRETRLGWTIEWGDALKPYTTK